MMRIYFDESGWTGEDFFNPSQPIFTLASINISETLCEELKEKHFGKINALELKHSSLSKRPAQQNMVIDFLTEIRDNAYPIKLSVSLKQYVLVTKMVDILIEQLMHDDGTNLYKRGGNIALSNLIYYVVPSLAGKEFFLEMISSFQKMMTERTNESYSKFFGLFLNGGLPKELEEIFLYFKLFYTRYGISFIRKLPENLLEIAYSCALVLVQKWSSEASENFVIEHDESSEMQNSLNLWKKVVSPDVMRAVVGYDRRKATYPLKVEKTEFRKSNESIGLQLADVLAGAVTRYMTWLCRGHSADDEYANKLNCVLNGFPLAHSLLPELKVTPAELGTIGEDGIDPNEFLMEIMK